MRIIYLIRLVIFLFPYYIISQSENLCPALTNSIKIEDPNNTPNITENTENGTITLTFNQQSVNDIFNGYLIYDFYQSFPSGSENLQKFYTVAHNSRDLINEINDQVPTNIIQVDFTYSSTALDPSVINFLDGKQFRYKKYCSDIPEVGEYCADNEQIMDNNFNLLVSFGYDSVNDLLNMKSDGLTPCENSFDIALRGGVDVNKLQVWESTVGTIAQNPSCDYAETFFNNILDIGCFEGSHYGDTDYIIDTVENSITLGRNMATFSYDYITLEFNALSIYEQSFNNSKLLSFKNNPNIAFTNINNDNYFIEIFSVLGTRILEKTPFENNKISTSSLANGLHFIKLTNSYNQSKVFKFLKM